MTPPFASAQSLFRNTYRLARRPSRLTLGAAAVVAMAGMAAGVSASPALAAGAVSNSGAISHAGAARMASHSGARSSRAASGLAPSRQAAPHTVHAHRPGRASAGIRLVSWERPRQQIAYQDPVMSQHHAAAAGRVTRHQTPVRHTAAVRHTAVRHTAVRHTARAARHTAAPRHRVRPARPYLIYDSITPSAIPAHHVIATYATGNYAASPAQLAGRKRVLWIDTTGTDHAASILDVEPGDATPSLAATWAWHRLSAYPKALARIYTMRSEWPAVQAAIATLPARMRSHIRWWIADPTGVPHIVPGSDATQWYWGSSYDITTATPRF